MSVAMMWFVLIAFIFAIFVFGGVLMMFLIKAFDSKEADIIDTPEEALEKKVFADNVH
ncbi:MULTISPECIES: hypothetical protein [Staphylococcaceae]|uniref:YtzI protein n=1 Tax=Macrococcus psychrotolerans TaxID=3039389 RepID=A0AAU6RD90_9STAP|nr:MULTISPECIES: hypothetical protein [Macrococcus]MDJ1112688.1 hypothetical protein [Macrococcus sp. S115]QYA32476.1 hypothetical protein KYI10_08990 [Macrococcus sp. 19Msa1099]QYA37284.1 hypothetical protein KYI07_08980 [Macrococcus caseolyticus]QYA75991.1 hypothetical protein KYI12_08980 [Macrococcus caseolyticus]